MRIIGLDPGLRRFGYSSITVQEDGSKPILEDAGIFKTLTEDELKSRISLIANFFQSYILERVPDLIAIEQVFFSRNRASCLNVAYVIGAVLNNCKKIPVCFYTPTEIKKAIYNYGKAIKAELLLSLKFYVEGVDEFFAGKSFNSIKDAVDATAIATTASLKLFATKGEEKILIGVR
jgi:crossover junction endodeoxyribonuclease RuvC